MGIVKVKVDGRDALQLQGDCNIYEAGSLRLELLSVIQESSEAELDLSKASECDTAGIQVLMAAKLLARSLGKQLSYVNHSTSVLDMIEIYDLASWLGDPLIVSANSKAKH